MNCGQPGPMRRHPRAYLQVRGGHGRRVFEPRVYTRTTALNASPRQTRPATALGSFATFLARTARNAKHPVLCRCALRLAPGMGAAGGHNQPHGQVRRPPVKARRSARCRRPARRGKLAVATSRRIMASLRPLGPVGEVVASGQGAWVLGRDTRSCTGNSSVSRSRDAAGSPARSSGRVRSRWSVFAGAPGRECARAEAAVRRAGSGHWPHPLPVRSSWRGHPRS